MKYQNSNFASRGGRPFAENPRKHTLSTKLNRDELNIALNRIQASGLRRSEALRVLILNEDLPKVIHRGIDISASKAYQNLQPLQSNLNQIAHALNSDKTAQLDVNGVNAIVKFIRKIEHEVRALRQEIIATPGE